MHARLLAVVFSFLAAPLSAGLVDKHFPDKDEATVAKEFEAGLGEYLAGRLKDPGIVVRMFATVAKNTEVYVQLKSVDGDNSTWITLVPNGWIKGSDRNPPRWGFEPFGKEYTIRLVDLAPAEVAIWCSPRTRTTAECVACACWLASKNLPWLANGEVAALADAKPDLKPDISEWLAARNGWTLPSEGLESVPTTDLKHEEDGFLLLTKEAKAAWIKLLDDEIKTTFKELEKMQGDDVKSKPGMRKNSPTLRLELLQDYVARFAKRYALTAFMAKKGAKEVQAIADAVAADLAWIETEKYKAERKGIDKDWKGAAALYDPIKRADPNNPDILFATADAWHRAAEVTDGGRKAVDPAAAKKAALLYEELIAIYPKQLGYRNHAGVNWLAAGDKTKSKEHHQEVVRRTDDIKEMTDSEKSNREFAEGQLKLIG